MTKYRCVSLIVTSYRHRGVPNGELQTLATGRSTVATKHLSLITLWLVTPSVDGQRYGLWLQCDVRPSSVVADQSNAAAAAAAAACCTLTYLYAVCRHSWPSSVMIRYIQPLYYGDWKPTDDNRTSKSHVILRFFSPEKFLRPFHESGIERVVAAQATSCENFATVGFRAAAEVGLDKYRISSYVPWMVTDDLIIAASLQRLK